MLDIHVGTVRVFIHVLAATVWVGGQITLAGMVPAMRKLGPDATKAAARAFQRIAWPAFAALIATGIWNVAVQADLHKGDTAWWTTLFVKLVIVAASGISAGVHAGTSNRKALAIGGAVGGLTALAAVFFGVLLHGTTFH
jgi:putative copper export protein